MGQRLKVNSFTLNNVFSTTKKVAEVNGRVERLISLQAPEQGA
jgi:hypothetical protein